MKLIKIIAVVSLLSASYLQAQVVDAEVVIKIFNDQGDLEVWMAGLTGIKDVKTLLEDLDTFSDKARNKTPICIRASQKCSFIKIARLIESLTNRKFTVYVYPLKGDCLFQATSCVND